MIGAGSDDSRFDIPFGVPIPVKGGRYLIRVELTDVQGTRLAANLQSRTKSPVDLAG